MKDRLKGEYYRHVTMLLRSKLYGGNVMKGMKPWAMLVIRYTVGIIEWTKKELKAIDIETRKMMAMEGVFGQKGDSDLLYLLRNEGRESND